MNDSFSILMMVRVLMMFLLEGEFFVFLMHSIIRL